MTATTTLPTLYQEFIALSRYSKFQSSIGRREKWGETVDRSRNWWKARHPEHAAVLDEIYDGVAAQEQMPSMRSLMTAGPALDRDFMASYNCAASAITGYGPTLSLWDDKMPEYGFDSPISLKINRPIVFDELFYILLCGTGVGFSVERQFIAELPTVGKPLSRDMYKRTKVNYPGVDKHELSYFDKKQNTIHVADSKYGWASSLRILIVELYNGNFDVKWDVSAVRPAGEPLKTFGGRASGPQALEKMFENLIGLFRHAAGRKLSSIEAHDTMCFIAEAVVVGGTRRCMPENTPVMTPSGFKAIKDVVAGDTIVTGGIEASVVAAECTGEKQLLTIKHRFGELKCTPEHEVAVFNSFMKYEFKRAKDIVEGDRLVWDSVGFDGVATKLPPVVAGEHFNDNPVLSPTEVTTDIAWLIGLVHGDGYVGERSLEIAGNLHQIHILERAASILSRVFGVETTCGHDGRPGVGARTRTNSRALAKWFAEHVKQPNTTIHIPEFVANSTRDVRFAYLAGVLDADGRVNPKDSRIDQANTVYPEFADELVTVLAGLGISALISFTDAAGRRASGDLARDSYTVRLAGNTNRKFFVAGAQQYCAKLDGYTDTYNGAADFSFPLRWSNTTAGYKTDGNINVHTLRYDLPLLPTRVLSVEDGGVAMTYDIEVAEINQFTANGLVVHNSALISLSNLSDERMRYAKSGEWWATDPQRALANNSVAYTEKPAAGPFMREWQSIYESKSGERGILNREAAKKTCEATGRDPNHEFITNPCFAPGTLVHTKAGHFQIEDLVGRTVEVWDGFGWVEADNFRVTATDQEVSTITLHDGTEITATPYHKFILVDGTRKELKDLTVGDELAPSTAPETHGTVELKGAYLKGFALGDGTVANGRPIILVFKPKLVCAERLIASANELEITNTYARIIEAVDLVPRGLDKSAMRGLTARKESLVKWCGEYRQGLPAEAFAWTKASKIEFLAGLFDADGSASDNEGGFMYQLTSVSKQQLLDVQVLLKSIGVKSKLAVTRERGVHDFGPERGGVYNVKAEYRLTISQAASIMFSAVASFSRLKSFADKNVAHNVRSKANRVVSVVPAGVEEKVYCCTVDTTHAFCLSAGVYVGQCGEILLRDSGQTCNLTSVMVRPDDTLESLSRKIANSTILGTFQATLTDFVYVSPRWKKNCEEERLLGVSMTGTTDHPVLRETSEEAAKWLRELAKVAVDTNAEWADKLGINKAAAIRTVKPEGTVSQLTDTASGLHPRFSPYYIRRVRADAKDPLAQVMRDQGFPHEVDVMQPSNLVFSFPIKSPDSATLRGDRTAVQQLEYWRMFKQNWCDSHNPSITVYVGEDEWPAVGAWVFDNFDDICGVSFLPRSEHIYQQAPYEECTKDEYEALLEKLPKFIDYEALSKLETTDLTTGMREFACVGGACEI